ncbi:lectin-like domain-containing protein [Chitinophaga sp. MM2321]|uniref:lectin-like domain-containing protein n=1 Tax=Chitinophaga sp. MM2321 TaxID=3137178 RepID=UPI0032D58B78
MKKIRCLAACLLCLYGVVHAQLQQPYILNGSATQRTCNCYVLTEDVPGVSGTVWNKNKIDLRQSFNYVFDINLGCKDADGADGVGFILQTKGTNLGATGQGLGFKGISPSVGILIDTWQNFDENDPDYDHLTIQMNGLSDHNSSGNLAGPVQLLDGVDNIEDCQWHLLRIRWDAVSQQLEVSVDGQLRLLIQKDLVSDIFSGDPEVYWGFAGSTGGSSNKQQFCAALRPDFDFVAQQQIFCDGTAVPYTDNSSSFGTITRWWWDLGDGTISTISQPSPHLYPTAGYYNVKLVIEDNSGCISDTLNTPVIIGSYPVADFSTATLCLGTPLTIEDASTVKVGTLQDWAWDFGNGQTAATQNPSFPYTTAGKYPVQLKVTSAEGCSTTTEKELQVASSPAVMATGNNVCFGEFSVFQSNNLTPNINIKEWHWDLGNGDLDNNPDVSYRYPLGGEYTVQLYAVSDDDCTSNTVSLPTKIVRVKADAGRDTIISANQPLQLQALEANDLQYTWSPARGLSNRFIAAPVAVLQQDQTYELRVTSPEGCSDADLVHVKVYEGPAFYVPNAFTPNNDGRNDVFRVIAPGVPKLDFFRIWDRWGQEIFQSNSLSAAWDGTVRGQPAAAATYVWMVQGVDYTGRRFSRQGTVTLIR